MKDGKKRATAEIKDSVLEITTYIYNQACEIVGYTNKEIKYKHHFEDLRKAEFLQKIEALDEVYRGLLCKLTTEVLNDILLIHELNEIRRARTTLDSIHIELLERELKNEEKRDT